MGKFDGILICTDLDGTLYKKDKTISEENKTAIEYFKREGGLFTFITGRMPYYSLDAYSKARPNAPFGCINGGGVYDGENQRYVWTADMPDGVMELVESVDRAIDDVGIQVCAFLRTYFCRENDRMVSFRRQTGLPKLSCHYREVNEPIGKILFGTESEECIFAIEKILRSHPRADEFDFIRSERTLFEILPKGVHKGLALSKIAEHLGLDKRKTIAVGDYNNDIGMFRTAGVGIAVSNACPAALEAADLVTVSNEEHAIARIIYDIESGKISL